VGRHSTWRSHHSSTRFEAVVICGQGERQRSYRPRDTLKLELFQDGLERPVILLYAGSTVEVDALRREVRSLADSQVDKVVIHQLPFIVSIEGCSLIAVASDHDVGILPALDLPGFTWALQPSSWDNVEGLLEPFSEPSTIQERFQYLNPAGGPEVIYSTGRYW
jgi:hypothetical protein